MGLMLQEWRFVGPEGGIVMSGMVSNRRSKVWNVEGSLEGLGKRQSLHHLPGLQGLLGSDEEP